MRQQDITKMMARTQQRHTWPGIRCSVGQYVSQQVRDKPGNVRFR